MSDNIMSLFEGGKKDGEGGGGEFFSVKDISDNRLDLRWSDGSRVSLPYIHLHEVKLTPANGGERERILLHYPANTVVQIMGKNLAGLYDALHGQRVTWVREKSAEEEVANGELCIDELQYSELTDWELDRDSLAERRNAIPAAE